jgi:hypothetical protein
MVLKVCETYREFWEREVKPYAENSQTNAK